MNAGLKQKWIDALRSGVYEQARGRLREANDGGVKYCCLGVLLCVSGEYRVPWEKGASLASPAIKRMDLLDDRAALHASLVGMNDSGKSFAEIADYIEKVA